METPERHTRAGHIQRELAAYKRSICGVECLTHDQQTDLAQSIEKMRRLLLSALCSTPEGLRAISDWYESACTEAPENNGIDRIEAIEYCAALEGSEIEHYIEQCALRSRACTQFAKTQSEYYATADSKLRLPPPTPAYLSYAHQQTELVKLLMTLRPRDSHLIDLARELASAPSSRPEAVRVAGRHAQKLIALKNSMTETNIALVISIAKQYASRRHSIEDLVQWGNIGLMRAVDLFDYREGSFFAYAKPCVRGNILAAISDTSSDIYIPHNKRDEIRKLHRTRRLMFQETGKMPDVDELAEKLETSSARVRKLLKTPIKQLGLDDVWKNGKPLREYLPDEKIIDPWRIIDRLELTDLMTEVLKTLSPREEKIIKMRFGTWDGQEHELEDIARHFALTRERIRQIQANALLRLKHPSRAFRLRAFVAGA